MSGEEIAAIQSSSIPEATSDAAVAFQRISVVATYSPDRRDSLTITMQLNGSFVILSLLQMNCISSAMYLSVLGNARRQMYSVVSESSISERSTLSTKSDDVSFRLKT